MAFGPATVDGAQSHAVYCSECCRIYLLRWKYY